MSHLLACYVQSLTDRLWNDVMRIRSTTPERQRRQARRLVPRFLLGSWGQPSNGNSNGAYGVPATTAGYQQQSSSAYGTPGTEAAYNQPSSTTQAYQPPFKSTTAPYGNDGSTTPIGVEKTTTATNGGKKDCCE